MYTINNVTNMPVLRPLVGMDKEEIIKIAQRIGTFDIRAARKNAWPGKSPPDEHGCPSPQ
jgi:adenylyl- and sulfurtransferase ThiI